MIDTDAIDTDTDTDAMTTPAAPLRLAIYIPDLHGGGVERVTLMLIGAFIAQGVDLTVILNQATGQLRPLLPSNVRVVSLDTRRSATALPGLVAYLRRENPEVLMSSLGHNNILALWARRLARIGGGCTTRVVICQHNALSIEAKLLRNWQHRALPRLYRMFAGLADAVVGVSQGVSRDMALVSGLDQSRVTTLYNPVLDDAFDAALRRPSTHRWLRDPHVEVIVGIGRLVPQKDFATLLAAFSRLPRPTARLLILGEGPERANLQIQAEALGVADRFDMPGFEIDPLPSLRDADVMVMSSIYEGFGNVLVEALGAGVAVVSTRCPFGPDEILEDGRFGELVPVGDAAAMALAIERQLDAPHPSQASRQARAREFHVDIVAARYLALLESVKHGGSRPAGSPHLFVYLPNLRMGGAEISMVRLAEGFALLGARVTLVVHDSCHRNIQVPAGVELVALGTSRSANAALHLAALIRRMKPDLLLTAFPHNNLVAVLARWLAGTGCKLVITEHAPLSHQVTHMGGWRYRFLPQFARWAYPKADAVVAVSGGVRDDLDSLVAGLAPTVIHNPVLPADWAARAAMTPEHAWLQDESLDVVLSVSRLSDEKDVPTLVRAFAVACRTRPSARLVIAGEGAARTAIQDCIEMLGLSHKAVLVGAIANPFAWMRRARVFVLASRFEGFGNVLVEALAAGTRVVSTDCPVGPREVLDGGRFGSLVPVGDMVAMSDAIGEALDASVAERAAGDDPAVISLEPYPASQQAVDRRAGSRDMARRFTQERACAAYMELFEAIGAKGSRAC
ncbi:MAG: hypothetical protein JWQ11_3191 [Rhizobacter sp.]|nr:hypothetical protein [Rhizobacter sp.]